MKSEEIRKQIEEFLKRGGKIQEIKSEFLPQVKAPVKMTGQSYKSSRGE